MFGGGIKLNKNVSTIRYDREIFNFSWRSEDKEEIKKKRKERENSEYCPDFSLANSFPFSSPNSVLILERVPGGHFPASLLREKCGPRNTEAVLLLEKFDRVFDPRNIENNLYSIYISLSVNLNF